MKDSKRGKEGAVVADGDLGKLHPPTGVHREMKDSKRGKEGAVVADGDLGKLHPPNWGTQRDERLQER